MPPLALANGFFGGRQRPLFRDATLATRVLASSARLLMRQLVLGKGAGDEVHKGMTGNTMLIAQPSPTYEQVLPNMSAVSEGLVVLFCKSVDDVSKAQMLVVNREEYREMVRYRKQVCPTFADIEIDEAAIDKLPDGAVPRHIQESAQGMPEAAEVRTVMQGHANRIPMFSRQEAEEEHGSAGDISSEEQADGADLHRAVGGGQQQGTASSKEEHADGDCEHTLLPAEPLNENETVIGVDDESCPRPLRLFEAWNAHMGKLDTEAQKHAQAEMQLRIGEDTASAIAKQVASKEFVRSTIAVDPRDIASRMSKSSSARAEVESLFTAQAENEKKPAQQALAVPTGKPLSIFDPQALPAAYTEFLFGDCVPFVKRDTKVTVQQIFDALPDREELQYDLDGDKQRYRASER